VYYIRRLAGKSIVALNGELDLDYRTALGEVFDDVHDPEVVVDLTAVEYIDSTIVSELLLLCRAKKRCSFVLARRSQAARVIELLDLGSMLEIEYTGDSEAGDAVAWIPLRTG
jgi:anti-anti-sigma factor